MGRVLAPLGMALLAFALSAGAVRLIAGRRPATTPTSLQASAAPVPLVSRPAHVPGGPVTGAAVARASIVFSRPRSRPRPRVPPVALPMRRMSARAPRAAVATSPEPVAVVASAPSSAPPPPSAPAPRPAPAAAVVAFGFER
jgi:hypothetical protein